MKSYNHLWEKFISKENIDLAIRLAQKGKKKKRSVQRYLAMPDFKEYILDYANDFHNMDHVPKQIYDGVQKLIRDDKFYSLIEEIVSVIPVGIALGFYPSQWIGNWFLQDLDHYIKEKLHAKYYFRFVDDMVIFDKDKEKLHYIRKEIEKYLNNELGLSLKYNYQVCRFDYLSEYGKHKGRPLDFLGFKFYCNKTTLRRSILRKATRKARRIKKKGITIHSARQMLSYLGWIDSTDVYWYYEEHIKPLVRFKKLKRKVSEYSRKNSSL